MKSLTCPCSSNVEHRTIIERPLSLGGVGGGSIVAPLGEVTLIVHDNMRASPALNVRAFLMPDDSEPLLLGFTDFLTVSVLHCDYQQRRAYLDFRLP